MSTNLDADNGEVVPESAAPWRSRTALIRAAIFIGITAVMLALLIGWVGTADVVQVVQSASLEHLAVAIAVTLALPIVQGRRFVAVLGAVGYPITWRRSVALTLATWPISSITPSKSGELFKAYYLRREVPASATAGALLAERALDVAMLALMSFAGSLLFERRAITVFSGLVVLGVAAFFLAAPRLERLPLRDAWRERLRLALQSTRAVSRTPRLLAVTLVLTVASWGLTITVAALLFASVGASVPILYVVAGFPPALFAGLVPFTLSGMGTRDSVIMLLFDGYASSAQSLSVGILFALITRWLLALLGIPVLQRILRER